METELFTSARVEPEALGHEWSLLYSLCTFRPLQKLSVELQNTCANKFHVSVSVSATNIALTILRKTGQESET